MKELLKSISYNDGNFPRKELEEIISKKEEAIPELLNILQEIRDHSQKYLQKPNYFGHIYAFYLLAQFRVKELYPLFISIVKLPVETVDHLLGDFLTENGARVIVTVYDGNIELLKEVIEDKKIYEYARGQAVLALAILALNKRVERERVLDYYQSLLRSDFLTPYLFAEVISCCNKLYPTEVYEDIKSAYDNNLIESCIININDIERTLTKSKEEVLDENALYNDHLIENTIEELENWYCFKKNDKKRDNGQLMKTPSSKKNHKLVSSIQPIVNEAKVGRNDPCICGSGKKYKKCCG